MKNYRQDDCTIEVTAPYDVTSGDGVLVGSLFGVAEFSAKQGERVNMSREGVFELPKTNAEAWTEGVIVYWDDTAHEVTTDDNAAANVKIGYAAAVAANPSASGDVLIHQ